MVKTYPVKTKELRRGAKEEMKGHPTMSETMARRTARQNLRAHPTYYQTMPVAERMMQAKERNIHPIRKPRPQPRPVVFF